MSTLQPINGPGYRVHRTAEECNEVTLGIAISGALLKPNETRTLEEIAAYAGVTRQAIKAIEKKALGKLRRKLHSVEMEMTQCSF